MNLFQLDQNIDVSNCTSIDCFFEMEDFCVLSLINKIVHVIEQANSNLLLCPINEALDYFGSGPVNTRSNSF